MKIRKAYQGTVPENKILDAYSTSNTDTYSCNYINGLQTYSTTEKRIGTWTDNKPLYRKVIYIDSDIVSTSQNIFNHNIQNIDFIMIKNAYVYLSSTGECHPIPITLYYSSSATDNLSVTINRTVIRFNVATGWGPSWRKILIVEYTKTTD